MRNRIEQQAAIVCVCVCVFVQKKKKKKRLITFYYGKQ